jgi:putative DNA primase/helicase
LRILILTNVLPELPDPPGALTSRFVVLTLTRSFIGQEDIHLTDKLVTELPGILRWSVAGWRKLQERGHFDPPPSSDALVSQTAPIYAAVKPPLRWGSWNGCWGCGARCSTPG